MAGVRPRIPPRGWLGFAALVLVLVGFAAWSVTLVVQVGRTRAAVERNVGWLQDAYALQRSTAAWREAGGPPPAAWTTAAEALGHRPDGDPAPEVHAAIARVRADPTAVGALQDGLDAAIAAVRRDSAARSAELGESWGALIVLVLVSLLLAGVVVVLVVVSERRRRHALDLAAEIRATAETLAETRAELRAREAVAAMADELRVARDRAEAASAAKTRFMATMSHELLTPLNIIFGYAALVRERCEEHAVADAGPDIDRLETAAHALHRLLRHVLDLTDLDSGALDVAAAPVALAPLLADAAAAAAPLAARTGTTLTVDAPPDLHALADRRRLATAVAEVVDNACRFARRGGGRVVLRARAVGAEATVEVEDDGPGMRPEDCARAVTPFFQADGSATRLHDGAGLGLTVASRLCARMGGGLELRSELGRGTAAVLRVPRFPDAAAHT